MSTVTHEVPESLSSFLAQPKQLLINGQWQHATSGKTFEVVNPATEKVVAEVAHGDESDIALAVQAARQAFESGPWRTMTPSERGKMIWKI